MSHPAEKTLYRPEIDGLRAVAVWLVILYHLWPAAIPGGFIGVDIFFVISGFVVTGSVLHFPPLGRWQAASLFWRRRVLRIAPALLLMVLGGIALLMLVIPPLPKESYAAYFRTGLAALLGVSNIYFSRSQVDYFLADQGLNPYLHTWSLAVEEQFYLIFVVVFIALLGPPRPERARPHLALIAVLGAASYAVFLLENDPISRYYMITCRYWEIALGSILLLAAKSLGLEFPAAPLARSGAQLVSAAVLAGCAFLPGEPGFPAGRISLSVAATALLMHSMRAGDGRAGTWLARPLMVTMGKASYSIYLWHIPVFLLFRLSLGLAHWSSAVLALALTLALAFASLWLVEEPFRRSRWDFWRIPVPALAAGLALCVGLSRYGESRPGEYYIGSRQDWRQDWQWPRELPFAAHNRILFSRCAITAGGKVVDILPDVCTTVADPAAPVLLLIGDSQALSAWRMGIEAAQQSGYRFATFAHAGCNLVSPGDVPSCRRYWENVPALLERTVPPGGAVVITTYWNDDHPAALERAAVRLRAIARAAQQRQVRVLVHAPMPTLETPAYLCIEERYRWDLTGCRLSRDQLDLKREPVLRQVQAVQREYENVRLWDPAARLCPRGVCPALWQGRPLYRDRHHLSHFGAHFLAAPLAEELSNPAASRAGNWGAEDRLQAGRMAGGSGRR